ncbi:hypothetical protein ACFLX5_05945 [Chloroflexota bacterium]
MVTVKEVNEALAQKGLHIELPLEENLLVKGIEILEKSSRHGTVHVLLRVRFIDEGDMERSDLFHCDGPLEKKKRAEEPIAAPLKADLLPIREQAAFADEGEVTAYLKEAMSHLLRDKGYSPVEGKESDLCFERKGQRFFVNVAPRLDDEALERATAMIALRRRRGPKNDYALAVPAFQESLGVPLRLQERWVSRNQERLSMHNIGIYGVDNQDPNRIYSFTIYPGAIDMKRYFMTTTMQWPLVRSRYVQNRPIKEAPQNRE